jgi:molybdate transport system substrate-binding protein
LACALSALLLAAACGSSATEGSGSASQPSELTVFAASSLTDAFTRLGDQFSASHQNVKVVFNFAGSQDLVAQLQQGAAADVLACADTKTMDSVADLVGSPQSFAGNTLTIVVPAGNPRNVAALADLAKPDVKVVLAAPEVPAGNYAQEILDRAGVRVKPVSLEENVKGVVTKISLDEGDAGIVYVSVVRAAGDKVEGIVIPAAQNVTAVYPIATVAESPRRTLAQEFVDLVLSADGQQTLQGFGFLPAAQ